MGSVVLLLHLWKPDPTPADICRVSLIESALGSGPRRTPGLGWEHVEQALGGGRVSAGVGGTWSSRYLGALGALASWEVKVCNEADSKQVDLGY